MCQHPSSPLLMWQDIVLKSVNLAHIAHVTSFIKHFTFKPRPNVVNYSFDKSKIIER